VGAAEWGLSTPAPPVGAEVDTAASEQPASAPDPSATSGLPPEWSTPAPNSEN